MPFSIRTAGPDDAAGIAAIWREVLPHLVKTARGLEAELRALCSRLVLVAVDSGSGAVVGFGSAWAPAASGESSRLSVLVLPDARGRGIGSALLSEVSEHAAEAGAGLLRAAIAPSARDFAVRRGFAIGRELSHSRAVLSSVPQALPVPSRLRLVTFEELEPRAVFEAYGAVTGDDPSGLSGVAAYDEWLALDWQHPDHALDLSIALLDGSAVASFVSTTADRDRGVVWSNLTGTRPSYRGRGLAKVVKSVALNRCRDAGFTEASTGNDALNHPMLAVNAWLGYHRAGTQWMAEKPLPSSADNPRSPE